MNCEFCTTEATAKPVQSHCHCGGIRCNCPKLGTKLLANLHDCTDTCSTCSGDMVDKHLVEINDDKKRRMEENVEEFEEQGSSIEQPTKQKLSEGYCGVGDLMENSMILENETKYDHPKCEMVMKATSTTSQCKEEDEEKCKECEDKVQGRVIQSDPNLMEVYQVWLKLQEQDYQNAWLKAQLTEVCTGGNETHSTPKIKFRETEFSLQQLQLSKDQQLQDKDTQLVQVQTKIQELEKDIMARSIGECRENT